MEGVHENIRFIIFNKLIEVFALSQQAGMLQVASIYILVEGSRAILVRVQLTTLWCSLQLVLGSNL